MVFQDPIAASTPRSRSAAARRADPPPQRDEERRSPAGRPRFSARSASPNQEARLEARAAQPSQGGHAPTRGDRMAIVNKPVLVFADEPTTTLDVTVQAEILDLLRTTGAPRDSILFVTHDLGVVAELLPRTASGDVRRPRRAVRRRPLVLRSPRHPYTSGLLACVPRLGHGRPKIAAIPGQPPDFANPIVGCAFRFRCRRAIDRCATDDPQLNGEPHAVACWNPNAAVGSVGAGS